VYSTKDPEKDIWDLEKNISLRTTQPEMSMEVTSEGDIFLFSQFEDIKEDHTTVFGGTITGSYNIEFSKIGTNNYFSPPRRIIPHDIPFKYQMPDIDVSGSEFIRSFVVQQGGELHILDTSIDETGKMLGVLWSEYREHTSTLYASFSDDGGETWSKPQFISTGVSGYVIIQGALALDTDGEVNILYLKAKEQTGDPTQYISLDLFLITGNIRNSDS
jgi:hypothetical protein